MGFIEVFLVVATIVMVVVIAMSVGVLFGRKPISGSCGGLGNQEGGSSCSLCSNRDTCTEQKPETSTSASYSQSVE